MGKNLHDILKCQVQTNLGLHWSVPDHKSVKENEEANILAKNGAISPFLGPELLCGLTKSSTYESFNFSDWITVLLI